MIMNGLFMNTWRLLNDYGKTMAIILLAEVLKEFSQTYGYRRGNFTGRLRKLKSPSILIDCTSRRKKLLRQLKSAEVRLASAEPPKIIPGIDGDSRLGKYRK